MQCLACNQVFESSELNLGRRPLSSEFRNSSDSAEVFFDITLVICSNCFTIQQKNLPSFSQLIPKSQLNMSREPEGHLDFLVSSLINNFKPDVFSDICGLSYKDLTFLQRVENYFPKQTYILSQTEDLGIKIENASIESIENAICDNSGSLPKFKGRFSLIVARHILEHARNIGEFLNNLSHLLKEDGYLLLEVPDSTKNLKACDYTMVWEEHSIYLDLQQLIYLLQIHGFVIEYFDTFDMPFEDSLVIMARKGIRTSATTMLPSSSLPKLFFDYMNRFDSVRTELVSFICKEVESNRTFAIFGAGHLACAFVHYFRLQNLIKYCFDDTPQKIDHYLPGTSIPIIHSSEASKHSLDYLLSAISISSEGLLQEKFADIIKNGTRINSIFVNSPISIYQSALP